jgi:hypothetical protein
LVAGDELRYGAATDGGDSIAARHSRFAGRAVGEYLQEAQLLIDKRQRQAEPNVLTVAEECLVGRARGDVTEVRVERTIAHSLEVLLG